MKTPNNLLLASSLAGLASLAASHAAILAYEGFDYPAGALGSASGGSGWDSNWSSNGTTNVVGSDLDWGAIETSGGSIGNLSGGQNRFGGSRAVNLAAAGLLTGEMWFSAMMGYDSGGNRTNSRLVMVLGTESMSGGNFSYFFPTVGATGLGVTVGRFGGVNGRIVATQVQDSTLGSGFSGNVFGTGQTTNVLPGANTNVDYSLVVGRITWGVSDTIDIFLPGTDLVLGSPHSSLTVNVDQSGFDTLSFSRGDRMVLDEIRIGASYEDVIPTPSAEVIPEPSAWALLGLGGLGLILRRRR